MLIPTLAAGIFFAFVNLIPGLSPVAHSANPVVSPAPAVQNTVPAGQATLAAHAAVTSGPKTVDPAVSGAALTAPEAQFVALINAERTKIGENALVIDPLLVATARAHSREMCDLNYFDHHSPTAGLQTPMDRYLKGVHDTCATVPSYLLIGENIYYCSVFDSHYNVEYSHESLMHSPGHRANILEPRFTKIGIGVYQDATGQFWVTQMFMKDQP